MIISDGLYDCPIVGYNAVSRATQILNNGKGAKQHADVRGFSKKPSRSVTWHVQHLWAPWSQAWERFGYSETAFQRLAQSLELQSRVVAAAYSAL